MSGKYSENPDYREYERLTIRLHEMIAAGEGDSDEADALRDQMDGPWKRLPATEIKRLDGLSADLYMLADDEIFEKADPEVRGTLGVEILAARNAGDWETVLSLLRKGPTSLSKREIASFRAEAYDELGHADVARLFARHAAELSADEVRRKLVHT